MNNLDGWGEFIFIIVFLFKIMETII